MYSNALNGATFISTASVKIQFMTSSKECQCPEWGDLHFYEEYGVKANVVIEGVNALNGATFISTWHCPW